MSAHNEIKKSEQTLKEKTDLLSRAYSILNSINEACYELDKNSVVVFVNRQALEWWSLKEEQVIGKNIWELFPESISTHCYDAIQVSALNNCQYAQYDYESAVLKKWITLSATPTENGCIVVFREIDELRKSEQALRESKEFIEEITNITPDLISINDAETNKLIYSNHDDFWKGYYNSEEVYAMKDNERADAMIHPDFLEKAKKFVQERKQLKDNEVKEIELKMKSGRWIKVRSKVFKRDERGKALQIISFNTDITEQKKAEQQVKESKDLLQGIMDAPNVGIGVFKAVKNDNGKIENFLFEFVNRRTLEAFQGQNPTGKLLTDYGSDGVSQLNSFKEVVETGNSNSYIRKAESGIVNGWFLFSNASLGNGRLVQVWEDITAIKKAEQEILKLKDEITQTATNKYYTIFNSIDEGFCIIQMLYDEEGNPVDWVYLEANPTFQQQVGSYPIGKKVSELVSEVEPFWFSFYNGVLQTREPARTENYVAAADRWYSIHASPVRDAKDMLAVVFDNITERKKTEEVLRESQQKISTLISLMPAAVYTCDAEGRITFFNQRAAELWGREPKLGDEHDKFCGSFRMWKPDGSLLMHQECPMADAVNEGRAGRNMEVVIEQPTGKRVVANVNIDPLYDSAGRLIGAINVFMDITERKRAEQALRESEQKLKDLNESLEQLVKERTFELNQSKDLLQSVFDTIHNTIGVHKAIYDETGEIKDFEIVLVNREALQTVKGAEIIGKLYTEIYPTVKANGIFHLMKEVMKTGIPVDVEKHYKGDGIDSWYRLAMHKLGDLLVATAENITERKEAEDKIKSQSHFIESVTETVPDMISVMEYPSLKLLYINHATFNANGFIRPEDMMKMTPIEKRLRYTHPDDAPAIEQYYNSFTAKTDDDLAVVEYRARNSNGEWKWLRARGKVFEREPGGAVKSILNIIQNINEQKKAEEELVKLKLSQQKELLNAVLQSQELERERIGEGLHNGVAQLLYTVKLRCEMLNVNDIRDKDHLKEIDRILEEAISETRSISFELTPVMLRDYGLEEALKELFKRIIAPKFLVTIKIEGLKERLLPEYEISIYRIVQELVNNIIKHSQATEAGVEIIRYPHGMLLKVQDNGVGFEAKESAVKGKGIGLQSVKNRVQLLNAKLFIQSEQQKGTKILIDIPLY